MDLNEKHIQLLLELRKNPLATLSELSKKLNVVPNTVRSWIKKMEEDGILRRSSTITDPVVSGKIRKISYVVAHQNDDTLGLNSFHVLFCDITSLDQSHRLQKILDRHPYTYFRTLGVAQKLSCYAQFSIPPEGEGLFKDFLNNIHQRGICDSIRMFTINNTYSSYDNLDLWDPSRFTWNITFQKNSVGDTIVDEKYNVNSVLHKAFHESIVENPGILEKKQPKDMEVSFDHLDLMLLRELTINGKTVIKEIAQYYDRDPTTLSRRIQNIKNQLVRSYTLNYDRSIFNLNTEFILFGSMQYNHALNLANIIDNGSFPFLSHFSIEDKTSDENSLIGFVWYLFIPTFVVNRIFHILQEYTEYLNQFVVHPHKSARYYFYPNNYDEENDQWKISKEYIVDDPLRV